MTEKISEFFYSQEHLQDVATRNLAYGGAVELRNIPIEDDLDPELELSGEEIGFKLDPELLGILNDFFFFFVIKIKDIIQDLFKDNTEEVIVQYQTTYGLTWDEANNIFLAYYLEQTVAYEINNI